MSEFKGLVEYARSGRSACKGCQKLITKDSIRVGFVQLTDTSDNNLTFVKWYHPSCKCTSQFRKSSQWWKEHCTTPQEFRGFNDLKENDQKCMERLIEGLSISKPDSLIQTSVIENENDDINHPLNELKLPKDEEEIVTNKLTTNLKLITSLRSGNKRRAVNALQKPLKKTLSGKKENQTLFEAGSLESMIDFVPDPSGISDHEDLQETTHSSIRGKKILKQSPKTTIENTYTAQSLNSNVVETINKIIQDSSKKTVAQLKSMLKLNNQKISGSKQELLERVAEFKILGCYPMCEICGAIVRWNRDTGEYSCPGKYEDGAFSRCSFKSTTLERTKWND